MGLDMYLFKLNKKAESEKELKLYTSARHVDLESLEEKEELKNNNLELYNFIVENNIVTEDIEIDHLAYWRKHADLHKMMEDIYFDRGGEDVFNCVPLILSKDEIEEILEITNEVLNGELEVEQGQGFFWGTTTKEDWVDTKNVFEDVLANTDFDNETIYYDSWW